MSHNFHDRSTDKALCAAVVAVLAILGILNSRPIQMASACPGPTDFTYPGNEAYASTITLQMPFIAGETWTVGEAVSFYGNGAHCNNPNNDYYATDWNRTNDDGAVVLPVADGFVSDVVAPPNCSPPPSYGCYVRIDNRSRERLQDFVCSFITGTDSQSISSSHLDFDR